MENVITDNILLMLLIPLWIFLIIMCGRFFSVYVNERIIYALTLIASAFGIFISSASLIHIKNPLIFSFPFIKIQNFEICCGIQVDKLSLILSLILFIISFAVQTYSISYLKDEKKKYRFFAFLNLFNFSIGACLFSPNLFQMYVFWEIAGIISYLLIGFDYNNPTKSEASRRVFILNRFGDTALISGILFILYYMYSYVQNPAFISLSFEDMNVISTLVLAYAPPAIFIAICLLFIVAAMVKSAQFPFYSWLQDAMEAKLPVSALLHSSTLVVLGVFLLIRLMPFFALNNYAIKVILVGGILTALICSVLASIENSPKKLLAYSTSANLGLMFVAIGLGNIRLALILLSVHAFIKSLLFLEIHESKRMSYYSLLILFVSALSLAGLMLSGIGIKELVFVKLGQNNILYYSFLFISFVSAFYISRFVYLITKDVIFIRKIGIIELALTILLLMNIAIYIILRGAYHLSEPYVAAIGGFATALLLFKNKKIEFQLETPKLVEKFNNQFLPFLYNKFSNLLKNFETSIFENYTLLLSCVRHCIKIFNRIENNFMNGFVVVTTNLLKMFSIANKRLQSGNIQNYNAYGFILITAVAVLVIISYTFIISQIE